MYILAKLSTLVIAAAMSLGIVSAPPQPAPPVLGALVPQTPALYDGYLSSNIGTGDTSMNITPSTLRNGQTLSGYMCFVVDVNQPTVEYVCGTAAGAAITGLSRGVDILNPTTTSATLASSHRRFASVSVSDYPTIQLLTQKVNGTDNLDAPISYSFASTSITRLGNLVDKDYVDSLAFNGAAVISASTAAKGVSQLATTLQSASSTATSGGSPLVIPASSATSTYNSATAPLRVVVTQNNGTIDSNFIPTNMSGKSLSSTTLSATTTINFASTTDSVTGYQPLWYLLASTTISTNQSTFTISIPARKIIAIYSMTAGTAARPWFGFNGDYTTGGGTPRDYNAVGTSTALGNTAYVPTEPYGVTGATTTAIFNVQMTDLRHAIVFATGSISVSAGATTTNPVPFMESASWATSTNQTNGITSITFGVDSGNIIQGSAVYIYGSAF